MNGFVDSSGRPIPPMPEGTARANTKHLIASTAYFFKKNDGSYIMVDARSAWNIYSGANQIVGRQIEPWEYVGRTNGQTYINAVREAQKLLPDKEAYENALKVAMDAEFELSKKDPTPPANFNSVDRNGMPINLSSYGQH